MGKESWMWLAAGLGYGAVNTTELLMAYPEGASQIEANLGSYQMDELVTQKQAGKLASTRPEDFALRLAHYEAQGIHVLPIDDELYPEMLRSIINPPLVLYVKGDVALLNGQLSIGIVGARRPSAYGAEAVQAVGKGVALGGAIIVSGLAAGLDAEAHKAALAVNGPTIACIAFGHDHCYPAANKKLMEIIGKYGAVISEYPMGTSPEKPYFLQRNRIIAGISHGLVVGEARKHSGTMSTVNFATDYGRDVFAIPGSIFSELSGGTNDMIREGAFLAGSASDVLSVYGIALKEEDPVLAAAKQAKEGRPLAASKEPAPWQQSLQRQQKTKEENYRKQEEPLIASGDVWEKTLAEALQGELHKADAVPGQVSSRQAIQAFQKLQQMLPEEKGSGKTESAALDEMVAAVNDSITFSSKENRKAKPLEEPQVQPFQWDKVEHLSKKEMARSTGEEWKPERKARNTASPVSGVGRIDGVDSVQRVNPMVATQPAASMQGMNPPSIVTQEVSPAGVAELSRQMEQEAPYVPPTGLRGSSQQGVSKQESDLSKAFVASLSARLRTMHTPTEAATDAVTYNYSTGYRETNQIVEQPVYQPQQEAYPLTLDMDEQEAAASDPLLQLSETALRAYSQLTVTPVSLDAICQQSGLTSGEAMAALTELELSGLSRQLAGRQFVVMQ